MLAPFHRRPGAPQAQRHLQALRMFMQYTQVELHQIPADDRVRVVLGEPGVQPFQQLPSAFAVLQGKIDGRSIAVFRTEHIDLTLAAALQSNGIQIAAGRGLDVQRDQPEPRTIVRRGFELHERGATVLGAIDEAHRCGDEALHEVTLGRPDIRLVDIHADIAQPPRAVHQSAMRPAVQPHDRAMMEVVQVERPQLDVRLLSQHGLDESAPLLRKEGDRMPVRHAHPPRPVVGGEPETHLGTRRRLSPVAGQDKTLLQLRHQPPRNLNEQQARPLPGRSYRIPMHRTVNANPEKQKPPHSREYRGSGYM